MIPNFKSHLPGGLWPAFSNPRGSQILALLYQFEKSQYMHPAKLLENQFLQLNEIFNHSIRTVPFYQKKLRVADLGGSKKITPDKWSEVPILSRSMVQQQHEDLLSRNFPKSHGGTTLVQTSGSTGLPIKVAGTQITSLYFMACALRDHFWHQRDFSSKMAVIRFADKGKAEFPGYSSSNWGVATSQTIETGPVIMLNSSTDISLQAKFLLKEQPDYLFSYPSNLEALAEYFIQKGLTLDSLREVRALGETLGSEVRSACHDAWGVPLVDLYSAQEVGYIALQCPENQDVYHIQAENLYVEVVNEKDQPCKEGEVGRILITTLHNFAMPLIRYEIGDYAKVGGSCSCGRTLPVLTQVMGRKRNMLVLPNGEKRWPVIRIGALTEELSVKQFQLVQKNLDLIEARLVVGMYLTKKEESHLKNILQDGLRHPFNIDIRYYDNIPRSKGGKFEDFISEIA